MMKNFALNNFMRFWIAGLILLIIMIFGNLLLITDASPLAISDHQSAGSANRIDEIQFAWAAANLLFYAKTSMIIDLFFIGIYSLGAICGGILLRYDERLFVRRIGALVITAAVIFCVTDYIETIAQVIQLFSMQGSDKLAAIAAQVGPAKSIAFLTTIFGLLGIISWDKFKKKA